MNITSIRTWLSRNRKTVLMYLPLALILGGGCIGMANNSWRYDPEQTDRRMAEIESELNDRYIEDIAHRDLGLGYPGRRGAFRWESFQVDGVLTDCVLDSDGGGFVLDCAPGTVTEDPAFAQAVGQSLYVIVAASR